MERVLSSQVSQLVDQTVMMQGWVQTTRLHSKVGFIDLRDRDGLTQLVLTDKILEQAAHLTDESVITIEGLVSLRPQSLVNVNLASGTVEVQVQKLVVETVAATLPLPLNDRLVNEETRLKYRYLDLRSKKMTENLRLRHKINSLIRTELTDQDFVEIETPYVSKSTPEGARDYLIPSRIEPGQFYALPQSPQQYKQLLMVAGIERYFQIARCFRDEDSRGDRQPEFTQLDVELSFTSQEEVLQLTEKLMKTIVKELFPEKTLTFSTFPRFTYAEITEKYQSDKPDLRTDKTNPDELAFAFVVDFPLFEWKEKENRFDATHHPFTSPTEEYIDNFEKKPKEARAYQYDLVLNGHEIGGGSIRIHSPKVLERVFAFMGHSKERIQTDFGHLLEAFSYGVPPHGGIALGLDRICAVLLKEQSIRDVIAFPKAGDGRDLMMNAPSPVDPEQLKELHLTVKK